VSKFNRHSCSCAAEQINISHIISYQYKSLL